MFINQGERRQKMQTVKRESKKGRPSRLNEQQKDTIVNHYNAGDTQIELSKQFNVSVSTIRRVLQERR